MMVALQILAVRAAHIDRLVLHVGDAAGAKIALEAFDVADSLAARCGPDCLAETLVGRAALLGYR